MSILLKAIKAGAGIMSGSNKVDPNKVLGMIDDSKLTVAEQAKLQSDHITQSMNETSIRSKSRRFMAKVIIFNFFGAFWITFYLYVVGKTEVALNIKDLIIDMYVAFAFVSVVVFFFGSYITGSIMDKAKKKKE